MAKDDTNPSGRRVCAGAKPDALNDKLEADFEAATARYQTLNSEIADKQAHAVTMSNYLTTLTNLDAPVRPFDRRLWHVLVDHATITSDSTLSFIFKDDTTITA